MIDIEGLAHSFGDVDVLEGVSLSVEPGEFVALVGPNGAGKTTLVRAINGVLDPDGGSVVLEGDPAETLDSRAVSRRVATVPQDTHVGFSFTARQLVEMGRTPHRSRLDWSDDAEPVAAAMERTETASLADRTVDSLSGGERQRVLLARALAQETPALVLDEPTASLDINHQIQVLGLVAELVAEGRAALAAIHDLDLAARFCDRLVVLHDGRIRARGSPAHVLADPTVATAFDTETAVSRDHVTGTPRIAALESRPDRDARVHVAGGGEGAATAVRELHRAGFELSVGPTPRGDVTAELARALELDIVTAPAFERPGPDRVDVARDLAATADVLVSTGGAGGTALADTGTPSHVRASLGGSATGVASVDGGTGAAVEDVETLVETVERLAEDS